MAAAFFFIQHTFSPPSPPVQEHVASPEQLVDLSRRTCVGCLRRVGRLRARAPVVVQLYLQLPDQVIFGVKL